MVASKKAEKLIDTQQEESLEMASLKSAAESESKAKSQFLANISHELRTPLNAIIGFSEIINSESMGPVGNEQYKEFIKDIHTSGVHLLSLINDILDFSKAEENKLQIDFEQTDVIKIIKVSLRMVMPRAEQSKVKIVEEVPTDLLLVVADQKRLKQVILNPVSYTHLDVYKRQGNSFFRRPCLPFSPAAPPACRPLPSAGYSRPLQYRNRNSPSPPRPAG